MTVAEKLKSWLDEIGADGLMHGVAVFEKDNIDGALSWNDPQDLVPAYRHADGTYHTEPEGAPIECTDCEIGSQRSCANRSNCKHWLAHKGE